MGALAALSRSAEYRAAVWPSMPRVLSTMRAQGPSETASMRAHGTPSPVMRAQGPAETATMGRVLGTMRAQPVVLPPAEQGRALAAAVGGEGFEGEEEEGLVRLWRLGAQFVANALECRSSLIASDVPLELEEPLAMLTAAASGPDPEVRRWAARGLAAAAARVPHGPLSLQSLWLPSPPLCPTSHSSADAEGEDRASAPPPPPPFAEGGGLGTAPLSPPPLAHSLSTGACPRDAQAGAAGGAGPTHAAGGGGPTHALLGLGSMDDPTVRVLAALALHRLTEVFHYFDLVSSLQLVSCSWLVS